MLHRSRQQQKRAQNAPFCCLVLFNDRRVNELSYKIIISILRQGLSVKFVFPLAIFSIGAIMG